MEREFQSNAMPNSSKHATVLAWGWPLSLTICVFPPNVCFWFVHKSWARAYWQLGSNEANRQLFFPTNDKHNGVHKYQTVERWVYDLLHQLLTFFKPWKHGYII